MKALQVQALQLQNQQIQVVVQAVAHLAQVVVLVLPQVQVLL